MRAYPGGAGSSVSVAERGASVTWGSAAESRARTTSTAGVLLHPSFGVWEKVPRSATSRRALPLPRPDLPMTRFRLTAALAAATLLLGCPKKDDGDPGPKPSGLNCKAISPRWACFTPRAAAPRR